MDKKVIDLLFALIRSAIKGTPMTDEEKAQFSEEMVPDLMKLAQKHDLAHLVGYGVYKNELLEKSSPYYTKMQQTQVMAVFRYEKLNYEFERLCDALEKAEIPFIPLKGAVLRRYYPEPWMRTSCDIDILIHENDLETAVSCLEQVGYQLNTRNYHDVSLYSTNSIQLELHFNIQENIDNLDVVLKDAWKYVVKKGDYRYEFSDEFFAFHIFAHMAYHFVSGGCGIRPLIDIYLMQQKMDVTYSCAENLMKKAGIFQFSVEISNIAEKCLTDGIVDDFQSTVLKYIFNGGVYGSADNKIAVKKTKTNGTIAYAMKRLFIPYKTMTIAYPILEKAPYLLPFCWIARMIKALRNDKSKTAVMELKHAHAMPDDKVEEIRAIRERLEV